MDRSAAEIALGKVGAGLLAQTGPATRSGRPQHFLYLKPEPQGHGAFRPTLFGRLLTWPDRCSSDIQFRGFASRPSVSEAVSAAVNGTCGRSVSHFSTQSAEASTTRIV